MKQERILLSSPCGYFGEMVLWPLQNLRFAAASSGDFDGHAANPRSHFKGIRILQDGMSWRCEALVDLGPTLRAFPVPFSELTGKQDTDSSAPDRISYFPSDSKEAPNFDGPELSREFIQSAESYAKSAKELHESATRVARGLATQVLPNVVHDLSLVLHEDVELPKDRSYQLLSDWIETNRRKLLTLRYEHVRDLLADVTGELARRFSETESRADDHHAKDLDSRIEEFLMGASDFIIFLSRVLKLHWFLGHDDWSDVIEGLDGRFPRTPPSSLAWIWNHCSDAPWWRALVQPGFEDLIDANQRFQELELVALARAFLWPGVYKVANRRLKEHDSVFLDNLFPEYPSLAEGFQIFLAKFTDWWTYELTKGALTPVFVAGTELDTIGAEEDDLFSLLLHLRDSGNAATNALYERLSLYRDEVVDAQDWEMKYHDAFPQVGEDLSIDELLRRETLGFALKKLEIEVEGESAWVRLVHNAVFDDAYGPKAIFAGLKKELRVRLFDGLGQGAMVFSFKEKSDHCQLLLREFVLGFLRSIHGDRWRDNGIPEDLTMKVRKRIGETGYVRLIAESDALGKFFEQTDIVDYFAVLKYEPNWPAIVGYLERVGVERPSKKRLDNYFSVSDWVRYRNATAHPEKSFQLASDAFELLDKIKRTLQLWLLLTRPPSV